MNAPESGGAEEEGEGLPPSHLLSPPRRHLAAAPRECSAPGIAQELPCPAQPSRPAYMAAGSAFSLLEEFYFFAAIAATSLLEHLVRCFSMDLLRLDHPPQTHIPSAVSSCLKSPVAFVKILTLYNSCMVKIFRKYRSSRSSLKGEASE